MRSLLAALIFATSLLAQQPPEPIKLTVSLAAVPKQSLQYRLLPDRADLTAGNAATLYQRSLAMLFENEFLLKELKKEYWSNWVGTATAEWPSKEVAGKLAMTRNMLHEVELAARCKDCDWQISNRPEGVGLLLPDVQAFRSVGSVLAVKARHEIVTGQFADAARTLQTGFALARHISEGPTVIQVLVGTAIAQMMIRQVDAWLITPNSPNLYWPLAVLPRPFIDPLRALTEDNRSIENMFPWVKKLEDPVWTDAQVKIAQEGLLKMHDNFGLRKLNPDDLAGRVLLEAAFLEEARNALKEQGFPAEKLDKMPAFQITAIHAFRDCRVAADDLLKWAHLPESLGHPAHKKSVEQYNKAFFRLDVLYFRGLLKGLANGGAEGLATPMALVFASTGRLDRRLAAIRTIEAIRMHGKLPAKLDDVTDLPVPNDPLTRKAFEYSVNGEVAKLHAPARPGETPTLANSITYELRLKK
jgi:hypothetical protein